jgi:RNA polymerase sigma-70 factor, ECF subfamily
LPSIKSLHSGELEIRLEAWVDDGSLSLDQTGLRLDQRVTLIFQQRRDSVYRYLVVLLGNAAEAEDITQEVFLQLYRCLHQGQPITTVRSWIFRVAHNLAINRRMNGRFLVAIDDAGWQEICETRSAPQPNPEQSLLDQEGFQRLHKAVGKLSPLQRQCLLLRAEGFQYRQIAEILKISGSNVAQLLRRGIQKMLRDSL